MDNEYLEEKKRKRSKFLGILFIIWFVASIVGLLIFQGTLYCVMIFGQYFLVFGLIPLFAAEKLEKMISIPFLLVGICCIVIPYLIMNPHLIPKEVDWDKVIIILILCGFILAGLFTIIFTLGKRNHLKKVCTDEVNATVVGYDTTRSDNGNTLYSPVYGFWYNGKDWNVHNNSYSNVGVPEIGQAYVLKVNPENPEEFYNEKSYGYLIGVFVGGLVVALIIPILYIVLHNGLMG